MLDIELIRRDPEAVRRSLLKRVDEVDLEPILAADASRRAMLQQVESARAELKRTSKEVGALRSRGEDAAEVQQRAAALGDEISAKQLELTEVEARLRNLLLELPNLPDERVPVGDKEANQVRSTWGERPELGEEALDHVELCTRLGLVDYARGTKLGGNGYWLYTGMGAALEWALLDFFNREHFAAGYTFMLPPHMLTEESGFAAGQFPKFYDDVYHVRTGDADNKSSFLLPTSETAILNVYRDEILPGDQLPLKAFAYSPCYRREAGSHRSSERGTIRGHQFNKVEMFQFTTPEQSEAAFEEMLSRAEGLVRKLGLHYQTSLLGSRDASASMKMTVDVEVWLPSLNGFKEVSSVSWAGDYQARRSNIRYRPQSGGTAFVHTLNASGLATSRLLPAIVEQYQQPDGSVVVPEVLRPWLGTDVIHAK